MREGGIIVGDHGIKEPHDAQLRIGTFPFEFCEPYRMIASWHSISIKERILDQDFDGSFSLVPSRLKHMQQVGLSDPAIEF